MIRRHKRLNIKQMNNIVELKGKIVCKYVTPNKNNVLLKIGCRGNAISCFTADDSLKRQLQSFEVGDYINITGNIQSSKRQDRITQVVFIDEISCLAIGGLAIEMAQHRNILRNGV